MADNLNNQSGTTRSMTTLLLSSHSTKNHIRKSDGIVIFIQKDINFTTTEFIIQDANCLFTTITFNNISIISI